MIVVAGDTTADALAATPLSDPTDQSSEPRLQRTASSDPNLHPVGAFTRVDTAKAPILTTASARQGATSLSLTTRTAALDLVETKDGCLGATSAIVVGGTSAVPADADNELLSLGYDDVFRVAGADRYATAAALAASLGTAAPPPATACLDSDETDGSTRTKFYANSVIEFRADQQSCTLLSRTVVLADGITGIDALAAGWFTSFFQVPVLLTGPDGSLPPATSQALTTMNIDNLIVLGGTSRIPNSTVASAGAAASATTIRIAGPDRYATSVKLAETFGGWWPTGAGADAAGSMVCLVGSAGSGPSPVGAADALGAGPLCGAAAAPAGGPNPPVRALPPTAGPAPVTTTGARAKDLVPILLTNPGQATLAPAVAGLLQGAFDPAGPWCSSAEPPPVGGCADPGFVVVVGGTGVVSDAAELDAARLVAGGTYDPSDITPTTGQGWWTRLDLSPVFPAAPPGTDRFCYPRDGLRDVRWLAAWSDPARTALRAAADVMLSGVYVHDADGGLRSPGLSAPTCVAWSGGPQTTVAAVSLSGHVTAPVSLDSSAENLVVMSGPVSQTGGVLVDGISTSNSGDGASSHVRFTGAPVQPVSVTVRGQTATVTAATLDITVTRGVAGAPTSLTGDATLVTNAGTTTAHIVGEATFDTQTWRLRGRVALAPGVSFSSGSGGFSADLDPGSSPSSSDDVVGWQLDALVA